ncbi:hypothetical protein [Streptomyces zingiberis]|uniref:Uncharacterized protein n=1 Tax=Streptomyces zingiberis TaxID=2053010 RepID=A0ABX1C2E7_9ACTN|nr:hypothetical protein [Streptomyces zingiberis]NJQ03608.1 hypothetical protein [Streptomyces zingiberis]
MYGDLMEALRAGDARPLSGWLAERGVDTEALWRLPRWNTAPAPGTGPADRRPPDRARAARRVVAEQLPKVADEPCGPALLLLAVVGYVEDAWDITYHFGPLWQTLRAARAVVAEHGTPAGPGSSGSAGSSAGPVDTAVSAAVVRGALAWTEWLDAAITVENMLSCGLRPAQLRAAESACAAAEAVMAAVRPAETAHPELCAYLRDSADLQRDYYRAVAEAVRAVDAFLTSGAPLDAAIDRLAGTERRLAPRGNLYASELRAHRFALQALRDRADADWLRVEHGKIVYVHPFALRDAAPSEVVAAVRRAAHAWPLAGARPRQVHASLNLNDVWHGGDILGRRYEGALAELPDVVLEGLGGEDIGRLTAEIRFSEMGNHYVRFEAELWDASPDDVYHLMCHAGHQFGACRVTFGPEPGAAAPDGARPGVVPDPGRPDREPPGGGGRDGDGWAGHGGDGEGRDGTAGLSFPRLADLAMALVTDVTTALRAEPATADVWLVARAGQSQLVLCVDSASLTRGPAPTGPRREVRTAEELTGAMGAQVLTNPVSHLVGAIAEWARFPVSHALAHGSVLVHDVYLVRTPNTTLLAAPGSAQWTNGTRGTTAEFAASLDGLFAGWLAELAVHHERTGALRRRLPGPESGTELHADELAAIAAEVDAEKLRLDNFAIETRALVLMVQSPSLVSSPVTAELLRLLLDGSGFRRRSEELRLQTDEVAGERLVLLLDKLAARRAARQRGKLEVLLAVIAAAGVSGIVQVLQAGLGSGGPAASWALIGVTAIVLAAAGAGYWAARSIGKTY